MAAWLGLVRPLIRRIDRLEGAARQIAAQDFAVALPEGPDEIGRVFAETNRMARALGQRAAEVETARARLTRTVAERTAALQAANDRLAARDRDRRRFFADISHELRTPLTVISMEAQIGAAAPQGGAREAFAVIRGRAERLNRRIDDLLRVARSETGQLELNAEPLEAGPLLEEALEETAGELAAAGMRVKRQDWPRAPVLADRNWLRQVMTGAIRNAIRHAAAGEELHLQIRAGPDIRIGIGDRGPGIAAAQRDTLFDRFARGPGSPGFGLGLALSHWVMEAQGGRIEIESPAAGHDGQGPAGTTIWLVLPEGGGGAAAPGRDGDAQGKGIC
nr:HAMP domain-containing sensor histidine kinase [Mangrovicoccus algicola]